MSTWTNLVDALFQANKPVLGSSIQALRDNISAVAGGASGAPQVQGAALNNVFLGGPFIASGNSYGDVLTYDPQTSKLLFSQYINAVASGTTRLFIQFSDDGGSTWSSAQTLEDPAAPFNRTWYVLDVAGLENTASNSNALRIRRNATDGQSVRYYAFCLEGRG